MTRARPENPCIATMFPSRDCEGAVRRCPSAERYRLFTRAAQMAAGFGCGYAALWGRASALSQMGLRPTKRRDETGHAPCFKGAVTPPRSCATCLKNVARVSALSASVSRALPSFRSKRASIPDRGTPARRPSGFGRQRGSPAPQKRHPSSAFARAELPESFADRLQAVRERIEKACLRAHRDSALRQTAGGNQGCIRPRSHPRSPRRRPSRIRRKLRPGNGT